MEVEPITAGGHTEKLLAAWLAVRNALEASPPTADAAPTPLQGAHDAPAGVHGEHELTAPVSEPALPGADADPSHETATVQTTWRAPTPAVDVPHPSDEGTPTAPAAQSDLAVPNALLAPAMLTGLQIDPSFAWPRQPQPMSTWLHASRETERREPHHDDGRGEQAPADDEQTDTPTHTAEPEPPVATPDAVVDAVAAGAWADALSRSLRPALGARIVPQALLAAADQWKRGRCVVLACPQGDDPAGPAWAFVLWPHAQASRSADGSASPLSLRGLQVEARLQWSAPPRAGQWCHVRVVKEHHPRTGRQLVVLDDTASAHDSRHPVPCEVQLGPVLARSLRWCEVCVRIQAAQRFWNALGAQWSVHVAVSARPLVAPPAARHGGLPC